MTHTQATLTDTITAKALRRGAATLALALGLVLAVAWSSIGPAFAAGGEEPTPPPSSDGKTPPKKKKDKPQASVDDPAFLAGYRAAYATIYERNDYRGAITQLKALDHDDRADVANLIGYSYRKLGDYKLSQVWYERALAADPNHVKTWQYYGLWQVEQGHADVARTHLARIEQLCGTTCPEYRSLAAAIDGTAPVEHAAY
jgi:tetratricopeptide (TPR) repeat protein